MNIEVFGGLVIVSVFIAGWTFQIVDLVKRKKMPETDDERPYSWRPEGWKPPKRDRGLAPVGYYGGSTAAHLVEFGLLMYVLLSGNWIAALVLWFLDHWER